MDIKVRRQVGAPAQSRVHFGSSSRPSSPTKPISRPTSPLKKASTTIPTPSPSPRSEPPRPRAKVSSSANVGANKKPYGTLAPKPTGSGSGSTTPRAQSPVKQLGLGRPLTKLSPKPGVQALNRIRSKSSLTASSAPNSPRMESSQSASPSFPSAIPDGTLAAKHAVTPRVRHASISSTSAMSTVSSIRAGSVLSASPRLSSPSESGGQTGAPKIKAKVTGLARPKPQIPHAPPTPSPLFIPPTADPLSPFSPRPLTAAAVTPSTHRPRVGRTSSIGSASAFEALSSSSSSPGHPQPQASTSAEVRRYSTVRSTPTSRPTSCFTSPLQIEQKPARVDPALIPLPPLSPPSSSVSFSSRSSASASRSSVSAASASASSSTSKSVVPELSINGRLESSVSQDSGIRPVSFRPKPRTNSLVVNDAQHLLDPNDMSSSETGDDGFGEERTIRAEAKSHRKIADLEITTKSLLAINTQLEANKHKQAKEIAELKRKLRESRLILPPRKYAEIKASMGSDEDEDPEDVEELSIRGNGDDGEGVEDENAEAIRLGKDDEGFERVRLILDTLLEAGRNALALKAEDFGPTKGGAKVLHESEARSWRYPSDAQSHLGAPIVGSGLESRDESLSVDGTFVTADSGDEFAEGSRRLSSVSRRLHQSIRSEAEVEDLLSDFRRSFGA